MRGGGYADVLPVLQVPDNKADAVPCERLRVLDAGHRLYKIKQAAATSAFVVIFPSFSGFAGHVTEGHFNWQFMSFTAIAVIIGSQIGARVMKKKMKPRWIKQMFAAVLLGVAVKLLWKLFM
ncbi:MAG: hypothetical protein C4B58_07220 [Deltaproteobacteria bacterium]|nr:MAG: hypothetical protein C4B58_07220 [Deltaproteobacteria bacterium]